MICACIISALKSEILEKVLRQNSGVESVVASLVSEALVAADEPKEDVWKGVLRLQTREEKRGRDG